MEDIEKKKLIAALYDAMTNGVHDDTMRRHAEEVLARALAASDARANTIFATMEQEEKEGAEHGS